MNKTWNDLTAQLPDFINLEGLNVVLREAMNLADEEPESEYLLDELDDIEGLIAGIEAAGFTIEQVSQEGDSMISGSHWEDYWRTYGEDEHLTYSDSPLGNFVDWAAWADGMRSKYAEITVYNGSFAGTWYLKDY